jgi:hypothetical protein
VSFGVNSPWMDEWEQGNEPGDSHTDPAPDPRGPAHDIHYNGNTNPTPDQTPEGRVAASYFTKQGIQIDPWQPTSPGSLLYINSQTGATRIIRNR